MKLVPFALAMVWSLCGLLAQGQELQIVGECDGRDLPLAGSDGIAVQLRDGATLTSAGPATHWRLKGNVRNVAHAFHWRADCTIRRTQEADIAIDSKRPVEVVAFLRHGRGLNSDGVLDDSQVLPLWPGLSKAAVLVTIWLVGDAVAEVDVQSLPNPQESGQFKLHAKRFFSPEDAARCRVGVGVVMDGQLLLPRLGFAAAGGGELSEALVFDDASMAGKAFGAGFTPQSSDTGGKSLVRLAVQLGATNVLGLLLEKAPALRDDTAADGETLVHLAAYFGRHDAAALLLRASAPANQNLSSDAMPVRTATELRQALANGSKANRQKKNGFTPIQIAASYGHASVVKVLLAAGAPPNEKQGVYPSTLEEAVGCGDVATADLLEAAGAKLPQEAPVAGTLLVRAVRAGRTAMVRWLLPRLDAAALKLSLDRALGAAALHGNDVVLVTSLLDRGASAGTPGAEGETAFTVACRRGGFPFAEVLLARGVPIDGKSQDGTTALHMAAAVNLPEAARFLLAHGASLQVRNKAGRRPLDIALLGNSPETAAVLLQAGDKIDRASPQFSHLLGMAIRLGLSAAVEAALKDGWSPQTPIAEGWSALQVAEASGEREIVALLQAAGASALQMGPQLVSAKLLDAPPRVTKSVPMPYLSWSSEVPSDRTITVEVVVDGKGGVFLPCFKTRPAAENLEEILALIAKWRFTPPTSKGKPVVVRFAIPVQIKDSHFVK